MSELKVQNIKKSFKKTGILNDISFTINQGKFLSLLGPSGCGKSTLLRIINGLEYPDSGSVLVNDREITNVPAEKRNIGMVFQNYALFHHMTVFNNIAYGLKLRKFNKKKIKEKVENVLDLVKLYGMKNRKITELSGGQQQRVALARALVIEPDILLLDEPLSALDKKIRGEMQYEVRNIQEKIGITTIFVTHDQEEALIMSDKIVLMNNGKVEQLDSPEVMYNQPASLFASDFLGKANILTGNLKIKNNGACEVQGDGWAFPFNNPENLPNGTKVKLVIRGEHIKISDKPIEGWSRATVVKKVFTGPVCKIIAEVESETIEITCLNYEADKYDSGKTTYFTLEPNKFQCFPTEEVRY